MSKRNLRTAMGAVAAMLLTACSTMNCPLNNTVRAHYQLYGKVDTLKDSLTITALSEIDGSDPVVLNLKTDVKNFWTPMSFKADKDVLLFDLKSKDGYESKDTVEISKTNEPHFEDVDCGTSFFHKITGVSWTRNAIDSIVINNPNVNYDEEKVHFRIYFKLHD